VHCRCLFSGLNTPVMLRLGAAARGEVKSASTLTLQTNKGAVQSVIEASPDLSLDHNVSCPDRPLIKDTSCALRDTTCRGTSATIK
jgi:hypothetical protein